MSSPANRGTFVRAKIGLADEARRLMRRRFWQAERRYVHLGQYRFCDGDNWLHATAGPASRACSRRSRSATNLPRSIRLFVTAVSPLSVVCPTHRVGEVGECILIHRTSWGAASQFSCRRGPHVPP
jgi:hypothetical protein